MNQSPILSLCIPTYNRANILEKTISRIVSCRSFDSDVELVISDNCSTDNTRQVCEHFAAKYDNVKYYCNEKNTLDYNFIQVLNRGKGQYLKLLNDWCYPTEEGLAIMKQFLLNNKDRNIPDVSIFEIGKGFYKTETGYTEELKLAVLMSGDYELGIQNTKVDFYHIKGVMEELLYFLGYDNRYSLLVDNNIPEELHPGVSASINVNGTNIGIIGKLHPNVTKDNIYVMEINLTKLLSIRTGSMKYKDFSKFPSIYKDAAFIVDNSVTNKEILDTIKKSGGRLLTSVEIFDIYKDIEPGKKSMAYNMTFSDPTRSLQTEEVMSVFNKIITDVEVKLHAKLRG